MRNRRYLSLMLEHMRYAKDTDDYEVALQERRYQCSGNRRHHFIVDTFHDAVCIDYSSDRMMRQR